MASAPARPATVEAQPVRPLRPAASTPQARSFSAQNAPRYQPQHRPTYSAPQAPARPTVTSVSRPEPTYA